MVITSGVARKPGQSRLELAQTNVNIMKSIMPQITKYAPDAMYIIVSNPVDILTYQWCKRSGLPENHIIGSGTILDTARLQRPHCPSTTTSARATFMPTCSASTATPLSCRGQSGQHLQHSRHRLPQQAWPSADMSMAPKLNTAEVEQYIRKSGGTGHRAQGRYLLCRGRVRVPHLQVHLLDGMDTTLTVSTMMHGEYGIDDVCLSTLNIVGWEGVHAKLLRSASPRKRPA